MNATLMFEKKSDGNAYSFYLKDMIIDYFMFILIGKEKVTLQPIPLSVKLQLVRNSPVTRVADFIVYKRDECCVKCYRYKSHTFILSNTPALLMLHNIF